LNWKWIWRWPLEGRGRTEKEWLSGAKQSRGDNVIYQQQDICVQKREIGMGILFFFLPSRKRDKSMMKECVVVMMTESE
jgi:hypothetical protein